MFSVPPKARLSSAARKKSSGGGGGGSSTYRYFRFSNFADTALLSSNWDVTEIQLFDNTTLHTGITCTINFALNSGSAAAMTDGIIQYTNTAFNTNFPAVRIGAVVNFDMGSVKTVTHVKVWLNGSGTPTFPSGFDFEGSSDGVTYTKISTVTYGTSYTSAGTFIWEGPKVAVL